MTCCGSLVDYEADTTVQLSLDDLNTPRGLTRAELMTSREVAELLDVPISTVLEWVATARSRA